jgi:hypothetical protein
MFKNVTSAVLSLLLLLPATTVLSAVYQVPWEIPTADTGPYEDFEVGVGDVVDFVWDGFHNVFLYNSGTCNPSAGRQLIGIQSPTSYTFTEADVGKTLTFVCGVNDGAHCAQGQLIRITVLDVGSPSSVPEESPSDVPSDMPSMIPSDMPSEGPSASVFEDSLCAANPTCASLELTGECCPSADGINLDCCFGITPLPTPPSVAPSVPAAPQLRVRHL